MSACVCTCVCTCVFECLDGADTRDQAMGMEYMCSLAAAMVSCGHGDMELRLCEVVSHKRARAHMAAAVMT